MAWIKFTLIRMAEEVWTLQFFKYYHGPGAMVVEETLCAFSKWLR
jgi:hypothetical protein